MMTIALGIVLAFIVLNVIVLILEYPKIILGILFYAALAIALAIWYLIR